MAEVLNIERAVQRLEGDRKFYGDLLTIFRTDVRKHFATIKTAHQTDNFNTIKSGAHTIHSAALGIGAEQVAEHARKVEALAQMQAEAVRSAIDGLQQAIDELDAKVATLDL
jgi:HPt (histidine-containing phosphotransfer) domain-containing protein